MGSPQTGFMSSVSVITVDVLGSAQLNFTHGHHPTILQPKPQSFHFIPMKFFSEHNRHRIFLVHAAQFPRLKVQQGSIC